MKRVCIAFHYDAYVLFDIDILYFYLVIWLAAMNQ